MATERASERAGGGERAQDARERRFAARRAAKQTDKKSAKGRKPVTVTKLSSNGTLKRAVGSQGRNIRAAIKAREAAGAKIKPNAGRTKASLGTTGSAGRVRGQSITAAAKTAPAGKGDASRG